MSEFPGCVSQLVGFEVTATNRYPARLFLNREHGPGKIISFDRVTQTVESYDGESLLFSLPVEIINIISSFVAKDCLGSLALVSRHALQLSRSVRFSDLWLDYSERSFAFLAKVWDETDKHAVKTKPPSLPPLGCCVNRILLCTVIDFVELRHRIELGTPPSTEVTVARLHAANDEYYNRYLPAIDHALQHTLPNIEVFSWADTTNIPHSSIIALTASNVTRLSLNHVRMTDKLDSGLDGLAAKTVTDVKYRRGEVEDDSPRTSLACKLSTYVKLRYLKLDWAGKHKHIGASLGWIFLCLCAPSLESLRFCNTAVALLNNTFEHSNLHFPRLETLRFDPETTIHESDLWSMLYSGKTKLRTLEISMKNVSAPSDGMSLTMPSLRVLVDHASWFIHEKDFGFLTQNAQIQKLSLTNGIPGPLLSTYLLPTLVEHFSNLTSLDICCQEPSFPIDALRLIAKMVQLQQLRLSAGRVYGQGHSWTAEHSKIQDILHGMPKLHKLAFHRDIYPQITTSEFDGFFENQESQSGTPIASEYDDDSPFFESLSNEEIDELEPDISSFMHHMRRMKKDVFTYARFLPRLDWLHIGRACFTIKHRDVGQPIITRKSAYTLMSHEMEMFMQD